MKYLSLITFFIFTATLTYAQRDTVRKQTIDITSSYKPVLRSAVKINLAATPLPADTSRPRLRYSIPAQNLFFSYQPITLKPLALLQDSTLALGLRNYIKAGFGNYGTPYVNAGFSFGDGKTSLVNVYADYISSKGSIKNQDYSEFNVKGLGSIFSAKNEKYGGIGFSSRGYHQYGYDHQLYDFSKSTIKRQFQDIMIGGGIKNIATNDARFSYDPHFEAHIFSRGNDVSESSLIVETPVEKKFGDAFSVKVSAKADLTRLTNKTITTGNDKITNNLFSISPSLVITSDKFVFNAGINPTWDNSAVTMMPNLFGEFQLQDRVLMVQGGWVGRFIKNSYRTLSLNNPYMNDPGFLANTKEQQLYGGIKATVGKHLNFNARAAYIAYTNIPLFINDTIDGKGFNMVNERRLRNFQIHGDASIISQDKFTITAAVDLNNYGGTVDNQEPWHLVPLELTGSFRWNAFKQVLFKGDVHSFSGSKARLKGGEVKNLKGGTDLSAGAEFRVNDKFRAWADLNNIFNNKYQRWNNYPVLGFQVMGGIIYNF